MSFVCHTHCVNPKVPAVQINSGPAVGYQWAEKRRDSSLTDWRRLTVHIVWSDFRSAFHFFSPIRFRLFHKSNGLLILPRRPALFSFLQWMVKRDCLAYKCHFVTIFRLRNYAVWLSLTVNDSWTVGDSVRMNCRFKNKHWFANQTSAARAHMLAVLALFATEQRSRASIGKIAVRSRHQYHFNRQTLHKEIRTWTELLL